MNGKTILGFRSFVLTSLQLPIYFHDSKLTACRGEATRAMPSFVTASRRLSIPQVCVHTEAFTKRRNVGHVLIGESDHLEHHWLVFMAYTLSIVRKCKFCRASNHLDIERTRHSKDTFPHLSQLVGYDGFHPSLIYITSQSFARTLGVDSTPSFERYRHSGRI